MGRGGEGYSGWGEEGEGTVDGERRGRGTVGGHGKISVNQPDFERTISKVSKKVVCSDFTTLPQISQLTDFQKFLNLSID